MTLRLAIRNTETGETLPPVTAGAGGGRLSIGRNPRNDLVLPDPDRIISNSHAYIDLSGASPTLTDTSSNGVTLNSIPLKKETPEPLSQGDVIRIGRFELILEQSTTPDKTVPKSSAGAASILPGSSSGRADPLLPEDPLGDPFKTDPFAPSGGRREPVFDDLAPPSSSSSSLLPDAPPDLPDISKRSDSAIPTDPMRQFESTPPDAGKPNQALDVINPDPPAVDPFTGPSQRTGGAPTDAFFQPDELVPDPAYQRHDEDDEWLPDVGGGADEPVIEPNVPPSVADTADPFSDLNDLPVSTPPEPQAHPPHIDDDPFSTPVENNPFASRDLTPRPENLPSEDRIVDPRPEASEVEAKSDLPEPPPRRPTPGSSPAPQPLSPDSTPQASPATSDAADTRKPPPSEPVSAPAAISDSDQIQAFLKGLGVDQSSLVNAEMMATMGATLRTLMDGMINAMRTRAEIKNQIRVERTMIQAHNNNPIKSATSVEDALDLMFFNPRVGFLPPTDAVRDTVSDLLMHETAMIAGLKAASVHLIEALDPERLEESFDTGGGFGAFRKKGNWEQFQDYYQRELVDRDLFIRAFSRGYDEAITSLKRAAGG
jgi:type VI secretion system FHA domain protein